MHVAHTVMYKKAVGHQADAPGTGGDTSMNVYFSNSTSNRGTPIAVDDMQNSSNGDVALVHLSEPAPVNQYMPLADSYDARLRRHRRLRPARHPRPDIGALQGRRLHPR